MPRTDKERELCCVTVHMLDCEEPSQAQVETSMENSKLLAFCPRNNAAWRPFASSQFLAYEVSHLFN